MQIKSFVIIAIIGFVVWWYLKPLSRPDKIDYLNLNYGNFNSVWVKMTDDELNTSYKVIRLIKQGLKPNDSDAVAFQEVRKKYGIPS